MNKRQATPQYQNQNKNHHHHRLNNQKEGTSQDAGMRGSCSHTGGADAEADGAAADGEWLFGSGDTHSSGKMQHEI